MDDINHLPISCYVVDFESLDNFFAEKNYDYIWHHSSVNKWFKELYLAKKYGIPHRILHSHMSYFESCSMVRYLKSVIRKWKNSCLATEYWSCSEVSKKLFFPTKRSQVKLLPNAISVDVYRHNIDERVVLRSRFSDSDIVIGHIARLSKQKNQCFLIAVFEAIYKVLPKAHLMIVGGGPDEAKLRQLVYQKGLESHVHFMGWQSNPSPYYNAFDLFLLPSLYEGLPLSVLEAQANGLPVLISQEASDKHLNITGLVNELSLSSSIEQWANQVVAILTQKPNRLDEQISRLFWEHQFTVSENGPRLENYFLNRSDNPFI